MKNLITYIGNPTLGGKFAYYQLKQKTFKRPTRLTSHF